MNRKMLSKGFPVLLFMFFIAMATHAQDKTNEERAKTITENMKKNLALADDQYEKAYSVNLAFLNKVSQVRTGGGGRLAKAHKLKEADGERDKMLKGILTEEQYRKFKEQKEENRKEMKKKMEERKG